MNINVLDADVRMYKIRVIMDSILMKKWLRIVVDKSPSK
jgi:hypothetical protein